MKLNLFEEFTEETLRKNVDCYNNYFKRKSRAAKVAWEAPNSQHNNFDLVNSYFTSGDSILDYGCGIGDLLPYLKQDKEVGDYLGVDINANFIKQAKKDYPDVRFQLITDVDQITGKFDTVCAIGVFTWFITKDDFIRAVKTLYEHCNKQVLITCLYTNAKLGSDRYWESSYRYYNPALFEELFPEFDMDFDFTGNTMLVKINR